MKRVMPLVVLALIGLFSVVPILRPGYFPMHDDTQVARVITLGNALKEGQFPVRWVQNLGYGYGYPIFNFYGPLPYYAGGLLYALGLSPVLATKLMMAIGVVGPAVTLFLATNLLLGWQGAVVASLLYLFSPYHAVQVYVRGAVGEYWTLMFWPLILFSIFRIPQSKKYPGIRIVGAIGIAGSIVSHTLLGFVTVLLYSAGVMAYAAVASVRRLPYTYVSTLAGMLFLGIGLSAFFWLPAFAEMRFTDVAGQVSATADYKDHFVCIPQLWSSLWGFGGSAKGCIDGMSFMLGKIHIIAAAFGTAVLLSGRKSNMFLFVSGIFLTLTGLFFSTDVSASVWKAIPYFPFLQYPWRFLSVAGLGISLLAGAGITGIPGERAKTVASALLIAGVLYLNLKWFAPQFTYVGADTRLTSAEDIRFRVSKISDEYLPPDVSRPNRPEEVLSATIAEAAGVAVEALSERATEARFVAESTASAALRINRAYFPGWHYFVNNREVTPAVNNGFPTLMIESGQSLVVTRFTDTPVRRAGNIVSLLSLIMLGGMIYGRQRKTNR